MKEQISRTAGNCNERIWKEAWMQAPRFNEIQRTSHLDVNKLVMFSGWDKHEPLPEVSDEEVIEILEQAVGEYRERNIKEETDEQTERNNRP